MGIYTDRRARRLEQGGQTLTLPPARTRTHKESPARMKQAGDFLYSQVCSLMDVIGVVVNVVLMPVTFVGIVDVARLVAVVLVGVTLVGIVVVKLGVMLVGVTLVNVVDVARRVGVVLVGVTLVNSVKLHLAPPLNVCLVLNLRNPGPARKYSSYTVLCVSIETLEKNRCQDEKSQSGQRS